MRQLAGSLLLCVAIYGSAAAQTGAVKGGSAKAPPNAAPPAATPAPVHPTAAISPGIAPGNPARRLTYGVTWKLVRAGQVLIDYQTDSGKIRIESAGLVSRLYKIQDTYDVRYDEGFCATFSHMDAQEGKRHRETRVTYDRNQKHAFYTERDLLAGEVVKTADVATPACVHDVLGALLALKSLPLEPGRSYEIPVSDGRKSAMVKIEAQEREEISTVAGKFKAIRIEAFLLNDVVYTRKGRILIWVTDDSRKLPVEVRLRLSFPIGNVSLELEKDEVP